MKIFAHRKKKQSYKVYRDAPISPGDDDDLWTWISGYLGVELARDHVCEGHQAPFKAFRDIHFDQPHEALVLGSRGSGKSLMSAFHAHLASRWNPSHESRILGGSLEQSEQVYKALTEYAIDGDWEWGADEDAFDKVAKRFALYKNKSLIRILAASRKAARGAHIPKLFLDEVDEIARDVFGSAYGMAQRNRRLGYNTQTVMTSTWHNEYGLMGELVEKGRNGTLPFYTFCVFEVLERCPTDRSGPKLENCPKCPLMKWCHEDKDGYGRGVPKAKRSNGHYSIDDFASKIIVLGEGEVVADYLCGGPKAEGRWFRTFGKANRAPGGGSPLGEFVPGHKVYVAIDYGVCTGAVAFQVRARLTPYGLVDEVHIFWDYYSDGIPAQENARAIRAGIEAVIKAPIGTCKVVMDPAGGSRDPIGPTGLAEYRKGGIAVIERWPNMTGRKKEALRVVESFVKDGTGQPRLFINARCKLTYNSFESYSRKKVGQQFLPEPADPQHPFEEPIDSITGGLFYLYPNGREVALVSGAAARVHIAQILG